MTNGRDRGGTALGLPATEVRQGQPVAYLAGEAVEQRSAAADRILLGVEQADPQPGRPGVPDLAVGPSPAGRPLVTGDEIHGLRRGMPVRGRAGRVGRPWEISRDY